VATVSDDGAARSPAGAGLRIAELERFDNAGPLARLREAELVTWFAEQGVEKRFRRIRIGVIVSARKAAATRRKITSRIPAPRTEPGRRGRTIR
jgi:hypothetical protein